MLAPLAALLVPPLVAEGPRRFLLDLAARLPFLERLALECHLRSDPARVDLSVSVPRLPEVVETLRGLLLPDALADLWLSPATTELGLETLLLELDSRDDGALPAAAVFLGLRDGLAPEPARCAALWAWLPADEARHAAARVLRCAQACGSDATLTHVGAMRSRPGRPLRVNVAAAPAGLVRFLDAIQMPAESLRACAALLDEFEGLVHHFVVALDVADEPSPRVGLECYQGSPAGDGSAWPRLLGHLAARGLCDEDEIRALLAWPGTSAGPTPSELPERLRRLSSFTEPGLATTTWRTLNHVKLVATPGRRLVAKAYLAAGHDWASGAVERGGRSER